MLEECALNPERHDRSGFACDVPALDDYLKRFAVQHRRRGISNVYVLIDNAAPSLILGYYTLSAAQVDSAELSPDDQTGLPRFPLPCIRMGRLAVRADRKGQGLGKLLVGGAVARCLAARKQIAAYALMVDAKDQPAKAFYEHYGFKSCTDAPLTLYLPFGR